MNPTLYDLIGGYKTLGDLEIDDEVVASALAQLGEAIDAKATNIAKVIRNLEAEANALKAEARRMSDAARARENRIDSIKTYVQANMNAAGLKRAGGLLYFTLQASPASAKVIDEALVPADLKRQVMFWHIDSRGAITRWKDTGQDVPGIKIIQGTHLVLRP